MDIIQETDLENINFNFKTNIVYRAQELLKKSSDISTAVVNVIGSTGIAGFKFHIPKMEQIELPSEITDYYTDNNRPVQDHIAHRPTMITLQGLCGDYFYSVNQIEDMLAKVTPTMALVKQFLPKLPPSTKQYLNKKYKSITSNTNSSKVLDTDINNQFNLMDLWSLSQEIYKLRSNQTRAYFFLEALSQADALFSIETRWRRFDNMVISNLKVLGEETLDITDFTVTFKQFSFTQSLSRSLNNAAGRTREQLSKVVNKGSEKGKEVKPV